MVASALSLLAFYYNLSARQEQYFLEAAQLMIILSAVGLVAAYRRCASAADMLGLRKTLFSFAAVSIVLGLVSIWPFRVQYFRSRSAAERQIEEVIETAGIQNAVVYMTGVPQPLEDCIGRNSPDLSDDVLLAFGRSDEALSNVAAAFPNRVLYRMEPDPVGGPYRLVGPIDPPTLHRATRR